MTRKPVSTDPRPPKDLSAATRRWFDSIVAEYDLRPHQVKYLTAAAHLWDVFLSAKADIQANGFEYLDRFEAPRTRPSVAVMNNANARFLASMKSLGLDLPPPSDEEDR